MSLARAQSIISRRFDGLNAHGIGFNDFVILYLLRQAPGEKLRRTDLAEKIGITASGVTRSLIPLEKIGLVKREANERDARVSYVVLTETGKIVFEEAKETASHLAREIIPSEKMKNLQPLSDMLAGLGGNLA